VHKCNLKIGLEAEALLLLRAESTLLFRSIDHRMSLAGGGWGLKWLELELLNLWWMTRLDLPPNLDLA